MREHRPRLLRRAAPRGLADYLSRAFSDDVLGLAALLLRLSPELLLAPLGLQRLVLVRLPTPRLALPTASLARPLSRRPHPPSSACRRRGQAPRKRGRAPGRRHGAPRCGCCSCGKIPTVSGSAVITGRNRPGNGGGCTRSGCRIPVEGRPVRRQPVHGRIPAAGRAVASRLRVDQLRDPAQRTASILACRAPRSPRRRAARRRSDGGRPRACARSRCEPRSPAPRRC